ncbi:MAG TPA: HAD family hydrolase [Dissulfurispiraceae bacterium]
MEKHPAVTALFLDIGGVLLTNGWDRGMRRKAAETFGLDYDEMDGRHRLVFDVYEAGKLNLDEYLDRVIFHRKRAFTREEFKAFMLAQSQPHPEMIEMIREIKNRFRLKIAAVSNEGRELAVHRIRKFALGEFMDFFVMSSFIHCRKPDNDIYLIALDIAQVPPAGVIYIEDRALFVEAAAGLNIKGIHHVGYETTRTALDALGLSLTRQETAQR